jgi:hypothetical protein
MHANSRAGAAARRLTLGLTMAGALAVTVAACSSGGGTGSGTPGGGATAAPVAPAASSPATGGGGSGTAAGAPDPCKVVTAADAAQLTGTTLKQTGDTKATRNVGICAYSAGATAVIVTVAQLPGATTARAQAYYQQAVTKLSHAPGVTLTHPGIGDKSLAGTVSLGGFRDSAIAFLKGTVYVSIQTTSNASPAALKALAVTALGRV